MNGKILEQKSRRKPQSVEQTQMMVNSKVFHHATSGSSQLCDSMRKRQTMPFAECSIKLGSKSGMSGCSIRDSKGQRRPKSRLQEPTKKKPKRDQSGPCTAKSATGILPPKKAKLTNGSKIHPLNYPWILCLFFIFAATLKDITIASHNLHSFKQSVAYHKACIEKHGGLWFGQELWLSQNQLSELQQLGSRFVAHSGMEQSVSNGLLVGRPYGGVSISWSSDLDHLISPLPNFKHKRVVGVELKGSYTPVLMLCVYMPFFNSSRRTESIVETIDTIAMLDTMIEQHPDHHVIIGGDFNSELKGDSPFDPYWEDFRAKNQLAYCSSHFPSDSITYHHKSLDQRKWIDHFMVSQCLLQDKLSNFSVLDEGDNMSDHYPIMMTLSIECTNETNKKTKTAIPRVLKWSGLSKDHIDAYTDRLSELIHALPPPDVQGQCPSACLCTSPDCHQSIQQEYDDLIHCLRRSDSSLPRHKTGIAKDWWTDGLTELKNRSIEIHSIWKNEGRPHQGPINDERLRARAAYKSSRRAAQRAPKQATWDRLHTELAENDTNSFWKSWRRLYNKNKSELPPVVNGISSKKGIADAFKDCFKKNSTPNNPVKVDELNKKFTLEHKRYIEKHSERCDCASVNITTIDVIDALLCMKGGKSSDADSISVEHLHNAPINFISRLASLFNLMLSHSFVPNQFHLGFMIPLVKDQHGNRSDTNNYRGITISPIISKVFEHILKNMFLDHLTTSQYQFGFKKRSSTVHALHCLRETVTYYVNNDSRFFCTFLDASKAFDRLVHSGLFLKLMERKVPLKFLNVIIQWYSDLRCRVKWGDEFSEWFFISAGVRQGGILSPDFYSVYVDDLILRLKNSKKGCYFLDNFAAALFYADDMAILAPSMRGLSSLLKICGEYCDEWDICLNAKKSKNLYFGKRIDISQFAPVELNGKTIDWVDEWVYLGVSLKSAKSFDCSIKERVKKFYRCANSIFRIDGKSNDTVMLHLVESHCVPILTYAIEVVQVINHDERRQLRVAYNSLFRKIFNYRWSESVSALQAFLERPTWEQLVEKRRSSFCNRICKASPTTLSYQYLIY